MGPTPDHLRRLVIISFPVAFALHDLEEILAAHSWQQTIAARGQRHFPRLVSVSATVLAGSRKQIAVAVGVVAVGVTGSMVLAWRDRDGDLGPLPAVLAVYTAHGGTHLLQALALRGYTTGVVTVPLVVLPYSWWAWRALRRGGVPIDRGRKRRQVPIAVAVTVVLAAAGHLAGSRLRTPEVERREP